MIANCMYEDLLFTYTDHIKLDIQITNTLTKHNITLSCTYRISNVESR